MYRDRLERAGELAEAAQRLDPPPQYEAGNPVHCRGEALSPPIYWQGRQWAVTAYGLECRDGTYVIERNRLWENEERYGWVRHMAGKTWADIADFAEALRIARRREAIASPPRQKRRKKKSGDATMTKSPTAKPSTPPAA
jgi:hypothetical protein